MEKKLALKQFDSKLGHGYYAVFTDGELAGVPDPPAGKYRIVGTGMFVIRKQAVAITLLSNDTTSPEYLLALKIISDGISTP